MQCELGMTWEADGHSEGTAQVRGPLVVKREGHTVFLDGSKAR